MELRAVQGSESPRSLDTGLGIHLCQSGGRISTNFGGRVRAAIVLIRHGPAPQNMDV